MILLLHGWACTPDIWDPVEALLSQQPALPPRKRLSFGYGGAEDLALPPAEAITLAVGHSHGASWLLRHLPPSVPLLAVNGFAKFCRGAGQTAGMAPRILDRMIARLGTDPLGTVNDFRQSIGLAAWPGGLPLDQARLATGLEDLKAADARPTLTAGRPLTTLAGGQDPIVPPALACTDLGGDETRDLVAEAGHILLESHPHLVAQVILQRVAA